MGDPSWRVGWYGWPDFRGEGEEDGELWVDGSVDWHRLLPGLSECQRPDGWWLTRDDCCWLEPTWDYTMSRPKQNRTSFFLSSVSSFSLFYLPWSYHPLNLALEPTLFFLPPPLTPFLFPGLLLSFTSIPYHHHSHIPLSLSCFLLPSFLPSSSLISLCLLSLLFLSPLHFFYYLLLFSFPILKPLFLSFLERDRSLTQ